LKFATFFGGFVSIIYILCLVTQLSNYFPPHCTLPLFRLNFKVSHCSHVCNFEGSHEVVVFAHHLLVLKFHVQLSVQFTMNYKTVLKEFADTPCCCFSFKTKLHCPTWNYYYYYCYYYCL